MGATSIPESAGESPIDELRLASEPQNMLSTDPTGLSRTEGAVARGSIPRRVTKMHTGHKHRWDAKDDMPPAKCIDCGVVVTMADIDPVEYVPGEDKRRGRP
jgi:hypothetical protein